MAGLDIGYVPAGPDALFRWSGYFGPQQLNLLVLLLLLLLLFFIIIRIIISFFYYYYYFFFYFFFIFFYCHSYLKNVTRVAPE